jgi:hypothetical protein
MSRHIESGEFGSRCPLPDGRLTPRVTRSGPWNKDLRPVAIGGFFCYQRRMNTGIDLIRDLWNALRCVAELLGYVVRFVSVFLRTRASLAVCRAS